MVVGSIYNPFNPISYMVLVGMVVFRFKKNNCASQKKWGSVRSLVFVSDGFSLPHGTVVGTYRGLFTETLPLSDFALAYPPVRYRGQTFHLFLDASHQCLRGNPDPTHAGLYNHCCEDPTLSATVFWTEGHPLPIVRMVTRTTLRRNSQLTYNYDAHIADGAYTISADLAAGQPCTPCRCSPAGCPRNRFFPAF